MTATLALRLATPGDIPAVAALIERSVQGLQAAEYTRRQRDAAIGHVFLVDRGLIADGSYFVVETAEGRIVGAGGWSNRVALHGAHTLTDTGERIDPATDAARIRAYFVDPDFARMGIASSILTTCEAAAQVAGFTRATLGATLTGVPFYSRRGYVESGREETPLPGGQSMTIVHMLRMLDNGSEATSPTDFSPQTAKSA